ncbi:hypothetical protein [Croceimicrobium hydrocarbonivorans]|uniref:Uncharacterized protein n=1 Tax=Croceimicrobium hydrocarbonivorans TaxID=2761580 RepID=A0A7H0VFR3_9FLAO|nr:hypothetical protein [Croceimicrobium hydrocarbonivorans]QNR24561.1 hypothetical protein H4K34_01590 [Croceimicrobium hydrocarbonivorans]
MLAGIGLVLIPMLRIVLIPISVQLVVIKGIIEKQISLDFNTLEIIVTK